MFVMNNFMMALAQLLDFLLSAYLWMVVGRAVISWVVWPDSRLFRHTSAPTYPAGTAARFRSRTKL